MPKLGALPAQAALCALLGDCSPSRQMPACARRGAALKAVCRHSPPIAGARTLGRPSASRAHRETQSATLLARSAGGGPCAGEQRRLRWRGRRPRAEPAGTLEKKSALPWLGGRRRQSCPLNGRQSGPEAPARSLGTRGGAPSAADPEREFAPRPARVGQRASRHRLRGARAPVPPTIVLNGVDLWLDLDDLRRRVRREFGVVFSAADKSSTVHLTPDRLTMTGGRVSCPRLPTELAGRATASRLGLPVRAGLREGWPSLSKGILQTGAKRHGGPLQVEVKRLRARRWCVPASARPPEGCTVRADRDGARRAAASAAAAAATPQHPQDEPPPPLLVHPARHCCTVTLADVSHCPHDSWPGQGRVVLGGDRRQSQLALPSRRRPLAGRADGSGRERRVLFHLHGRMAGVAVAFARAPGKPAHRHRIRAGFHSGPGGVLPEQLRLARRQRGAGALWHPAWIR